jgi:ATP-dependent Clp protease ATP-binding subunit ClpC
LFIERACTEIPADNGPTTALRILRPMILNGDLQAIVPVTPAEQRAHLANDVEYAGVFESVFIDELSEELAAVVLAEMRDRYESRHRVAISDAAITAAVVLSMEQVPDQCLPGKAIALMDRAAAVAARRIVPDEMFSETRQRIAGLQASKDAAIDDHDFERAAALREDEKRQLKVLSDQQAAWLAEWKNVPSYRIISVTAEDVAEAVAEPKSPSVEADLEQPTAAATLRIDTSRVESPEAVAALRAQLNATRRRRRSV